MTENDKNQQLLSKKLLRDLLPKVTLNRNDKPITQVWLTQKDALDYAERVVQACVDRLNSGAK